MKRSTHHLLNAIVLSVFFLLFATTGYGAYSDSISATGTISLILPPAPSKEEDHFENSPVTLDSPIEDEAQDTPSQTEGQDAISPEGDLSDLENPESVPVPSAPDETQETPQETAVPVNIIFDPEVSASSVCFKSSDSSSKGTSAPYFSYSYTDRSGNQVQNADNAVCHWKNSTLVAYANVYIPQNGLPGSAILTNMNLNLGAAIRIKNTAGIEMLLSRSSASGGMEQTFFNDTEGKLAENSVRLTPGQIGIVSAYLGEGWQLNASELDLENQPGMSCTHEYRMTFQAENTQTGERRTYAILLVISVSTLAPAETPLPTESEVVIVTPTPTPAATDVPAKEPTPSPVSTEEITPAIVPATTDVPAAEPTPSPVSTEEITPTIVPATTDVPAAEPTPSPVSTEEITPAIAPATTDVPAAEPTPSPVSTEEITPAPAPATTVETTPSLVSTEAAAPASTLSSTPALSDEVVPTPELTIEVQVNTPELPSEVVPVSEDASSTVETTVVESAPSIDSPPAPVSIPEGSS